MKVLIITFMLVLTLYINNVAGAGALTLSQLVTEKEMDVKTFCKSVEDAFLLRCGLTEECPCSYSACQHAIPGATCDTTLTNTACSQNCSSAISSGVKTSYTTSSVRIPANLASGPDLQPQTTDEREAVCYTANLDAQWKANYAKVGKLIGDQYFGTFNGIFRTFPGLHADACGTYDPRLRPWYIAASSGPKDIVLVIDTSGSMLKNDRLALAKKAAINVITAVTFADYVNVVTFSSTAAVLSGTRLIQGTKKNMKALTKLVEGLSISGATNFEGAFTKAFDVLSASRPTSTSGCQSAIIFLTDGVSTVGSTAIGPLINARNSQLGATGSEAVIFTYSLGDGADDVVPKQIACETRGVWQHVSDTGSGSNLVSQMSLYYDYFATAVAINASGSFLCIGSTHWATEVSNRTTWVEPYDFATGGIQGTTVSTPGWYPPCVTLILAAYDRTTTPPRFLGVCGIDFPLTDLYALQPDYHLILSQLVSASHGCPSFTVSECDIQSIRSRLGPQSVCKGQCSTYQRLLPTPCPGKNYTDSSVWCVAANAARDLKGEAWCGFAKRACCDGCIPVTCSEFFIASMAVIGAAILGIAGYLYVGRLQRIKKEKLAAKREKADAELESYSRMVESSRRIMGVQQQQTPSTPYRMPSADIDMAAGTATQSQPRIAPPPAVQDASRTAR